MAVGHLALREPISTRKGKKRRGPLALFVSSLLPLLLLLYHLTLVTRSTPPPVSRPPLSPSQSTLSVFLHPGEKIKTRNSTSLSLDSRQLSPPSAPLPSPVYCWSCLGATLPSVQCALEFPLPPPFLPSPAHL